MGGAFSEYLDASSDFTACSSASGATAVEPQICQASSTIRIIFTYSSPTRGDEKIKKAAAAAARTTARR